MPTPVEAIDALDRSLSWLARDERTLGGARHVETNLGRWAAPHAAAGGPFAAMLEALAGFDDLSVDERRLRLDRLRAELLAARTAHGEPTPPEPAAVGRLLPEGVLDDLPRRAPPPPVLAPASPPEEPAPARPEVEARVERPEPPRREERGRRDDRERRGDRREERPRREPGTRREAEPVEREPPTVVVPPKLERPPEPEVRTFPLGHPEATGQPLATLGVYTESELGALAEAGIEDVAGLLTRAPSRVDRAGERLVADVEPEGPVIVRGTVVARCTRFFPGGRRYEVRVENERGSVYARWLGPVPGEVRGLAAGAEVGLAGRAERVDEQLVLYEGEVLGVDGRGGDWFPAYDVPGVPDARMRAGVRAALRSWSETLQEHLPPEVLERHRLMPLHQAVRDAHFPSNAARKGRARFAFDELLQAQIGLTLTRARAGRARGVSNPVLHGLVSQAMGTLGWSFNDAQEAAFDELRRDLRRNQPMARLLQGDAGTGKQLVAQAAMIMVAQSQNQVLYAAPDAITAEHRFLFANQLFRAVDLEPVLLSPSTPRASLEALRKGESLVAYGTWQHLRELPGFRKLGLVVVEEGVGASGVEAPAFEEGGARPDLLVVAPAPLPAPVALGAYGHLALTTLPGVPARGVECRVYAAGDRASAYAAARESLEGGQQVMVVFPVSRQGDLLSPSEARRVGEALSAEALPGARAGIFHGATTREERFRAWDDFAHRRLDVLICTTFVEHGPPVPNASAIVVEHADTIDLVRLHRLRALLVSSWKSPRFLLVLGGEPSAEGREAVELLAREPDGLVIADADLARRGFGALAGDGGEDGLSFGWSDPVHDRELLLRTRAEAVRLLQVDPGLKRRAHRALLQLVRARVGEEVGGDGPAPPEGATPASAAAASARKRKRRRR